MSPEQAQNPALVTVASDVYSLGATLYALLTGGPPFRGGTPGETLRQVCEDTPVPPRKRQPSVPKDLETICLKCLEKDPRKRYQSADELAGRLRLFLENRPIPDRPVSRTEKLWRWCRRNPLLAALDAAVLGLFLVIAIGAPIAVWLLNAERELAVNAERDAQNEALKKSKALEDLKAEIRRVKAGKYSLQIGFAQQLIREGDFFRAREILDECPSEFRGFEHRYLMNLCPCQVLSHDRFACSPDGKYLAFVDFLRDNGGVIAQVTIWEMASGRKIGSFPRIDGLSAVALDNGGRIAFLCVERKSPANFKGFVVVREIGSSREVFSAWLKVMDGKSPQNPPRPLRHGHPAPSFSADGRWLAVGPRRLSAGGVWDVHTGKEILVLEKSQGPPVFSPNGKHLAVGSSNGKVDILQVPTGKLLRTLSSAPGRCAWPAAFSPDGAKLVTICVDPIVYDKRMYTEEARFRVKTWDLKSGKQLLDFETFAFCAAFSPDGKVLALGGDSQIICVDATNGQEVRSYWVPSRLESLSFSADGRWLGSFHTRLGGGADTAILRGLRQSSIIVPQSGGSILGAFSPDGCRLVSAHSGSVILWDAGNGRKLFTLEKPNQWIFASSFSRDGRQIVTYSVERKLKNQSQEDGYLHSWDAETGKELSCRKVHHPGGYFVKFVSPDGELLGVEGVNRAAGSFTAATEYRFSLRPVPGSQIATLPWDSIKSGKRNVSIPNLQGFGPMLFSPDSQRLAFCCADKIVIASDEQRVEIRFTEPRTTPFGDRFPGPKYHRGYIRSLAFSDDGKLLAGLANNQIKLWHTRTGEQVHTLLVGPDAERVALIPDGSRAATLYRDGSVKLWDIATGQEVLTLKTKRLAPDDLLPSPAADLLFSPDGEKLAVSSGNGQIEIFSAPRTPSLKLFVGD
jgi:WD40 repeat protein